MTVSNNSSNIKAKDRETKKLAKKKELSSALVKNIQRRKNAAKKASKSNNENLK